MNEGLHRRSAGRCLFRLRKDQAGNMLAMSAMGILVGAAMIGGGLDMSRAYMVRSQLQSACDAGVLAGRKSVATNGFDASAEDAADEYFNANFADNGRNARDTNFTPTSPDNGNTVEATATTAVDTTVMRIFGKTEFALSVTCSASMGVGNSDITMVLDTTGSMGSYLSGTSTTRLAALKVAMKNFYDTVSTATGGSNARIRYAFVPYSSSINVGRLIYELDPSYLVDSYDIQSRRPVYETVEVQEFSHWGEPVTTYGSGYSSVNYGSYTRYSDTGYTSKNSCERAQPSNSNFSNSGSSSTETITAINAQGKNVTTTTISQPQVASYYECARVGGRWYIHSYSATRNRYSYTYVTKDPITVTTTKEEFDHFEYTKVSYDTSTFKTFSSVMTPTGNNGANQRSTWEGCIEERATVADQSFSFSNRWGISPSGALDLDIDTAPDPSDNSTKWAPMWPEVAYYRTSWVSSWWGGSYQISNVASSNTGGKAGSYCPAEAQLLAEMEESEFDAYADSLVARGSTYHDIGMIWGARLSSPDGMWASHVNEEPANGGEVSRHIIFMTDGQMEPNHTIQSTYGIEFHDQRVTGNGHSNHAQRHTSRFLAVCQAAKAKGIRVWVIAFSSALTSALETCASDQSAFLASDANQLNEAFQEIANQVGELRITL